MYSLLLVDDEKIIREGVYELLSMADLDLDLTMAASAVEALAVLEERKIDIVLMDICMPQMSGLELYDIIREKWPYSKMIFLTGHLEFDYVYKVHKHARYVLKAEEDEKIVEAVKESIDEIENDLLLERVSLDRSRHQHRSKYYERLLLLKELVDGSVSASFVTQKMLDQMGANLDLFQEMYCVMIRCAAMRQLEYNRQSQAGESLNLLIDKYYLNNWRGTFFGYNKNLTYLLLQPKNVLPAEKVAKLLEGHSETFQKAVEKNLELPVSIFIGEKCVDFQQAVADFLSIRDKMLGMTEDEIQIGNVAEDSGNHADSLPEALQRDLSRKIQQLDQQFDSMDRNGIISVLQQMQEQVKCVKSMHDLFVMELYFSISAKLLRYVKKIGFNEDVAVHTGIMNLYNISQYSNWEDVFRNLNCVVEYVFAHVDTSIENKNEDVINKVKSYIKNHLDGDTSLYVLSTHVHLCPEHLLRIFKKQEGVTILQYINDLKLAKAKQMLSGTDMQIKEIATKLGFTSAGYFGRFFKSKLGVTPNVYRDQKRK